jgi:hypothetical protein
MLGGLLFVPMVCLLGILIAWYRRNPRTFLDGPAEAAPLRLMHWAIGLLAPQRAEWGQAMLGELGHIEGRIRRLRFALGCVGAALGKKEDRLPVRVAEHNAVLTRGDASVVNIGRLLYIGSPSRYSNLPRYS